MGAAAARHIPDGDDFRQFYRAATLAGAHESVFSHPSFSPAANAEADFLPYYRIPSYALALRPLAALPYRYARMAWLGGIALAFAGCVWLWPMRRDRLALALAFSFPAAVAFRLGQDIGLLLLIALAAARIYSRNREFAAGLVASLLAIKLSCVPAVGLVFLAKSRRGSLGMATGLAVQFLVSLAWEGAGWPRRYLGLLSGSALRFDPRRMPNIRSLAVALGMPDSVWPAAGLILLAGLFFAARRLRFSDAMILALPLGVVASPYCFLYDAVAMIPLLVTVLSANSWQGRIAAAALTPLPYLLMMSENPVCGPAGGLIVVVSTLCAAVSFYRTHAQQGAGFKAGLPATSPAPAV
jgi:hypothetical protein